MVFISCSVPSWMFFRQGCQRQWPSKAKVACSCQAGNTGTVVQDLCTIRAQPSRRGRSGLWLTKVGCFFFFLPMVSSCWIKEVVSVQVASPCIFVRFSYITAKPCMCIVIDDSDDRDDRVRAEPSQPCPYNLGRRGAPPLAELSPPRSTASPWGPEGSSPEADPLPAHHKRSKNDQTQGPSKTINNDQTASSMAGMTAHRECTHARDIQRFLASASRTSHRAPIHSLVNEARSHAP